MNIQIHSPHLHLDSKLKEHTLERINNLSHFNSTITDADVYFTLNNKRHHIKDKTVELKCHIPHKTYFINHTAKTFEEAFEHAYKSLVSKMSKDKKH